MDTLKELKYKSKHEPAKTLRETYGHQIYTWSIENEKIGNLIKENSSKFSRHGTAVNTQKFSKGGFSKRDMDISAIIRGKTV